MEALLLAGLDVYSTLNIQHLESLNDLVAGLTGVVVRERIPNRVLEQADEVVLVDVTPETLQERLKEGKVYAPEKVEQALGNFFQRRHLVALRELSLREVADRVEEEELTASALRERVMVCLSTYPSALRLLRRAARLASSMDAPLLALTIQDPSRFLTKEESLMLEECTTLCQDVGGAFCASKAPTCSAPSPRWPVSGASPRSCWGRPCAPAGRCWCAGRSPNGCSTCCGDSTSICI